MTKLTRVLGLLAVFFAFATLASADATFNTWSGPNVSCPGNGTNGTPCTFTGSVNGSYNDDDVAYAADNHEFELDHDFMYSWKLTGLNGAGANQVNFAGGQTIIGATITIYNIGDWDANANQLFMHLLDSATNNGYARVNDVNGTVNGDVTIGDNWKPASNGTYTINGTTTTTALGLVVAGTNNIQLNAGSATYVGPGTFGGVNANNGHEFPDINLSAGKGGLFTYNFSQSEINQLIADISNGGDVALGFDPDCHFFNDGIQFSIQTAMSGQVGGAPEPATLSLLALGLAGLVRRKFRRA